MRKRKAAARALNLSSMYYLNRSRREGGRLLALRDPTKKSGSQTNPKGIPDPDSNRKALVFRIVICL